jgi:hypothetical protein
MKTLNSLYYINRFLLLACFILVSLGISALTTGTVKGNVTCTAKQHQYMPVKSNLAEVVVSAKRHPYMQVNSNLAGVVVIAKRHPYMSVNSNLAEVVVIAKRHPYMSVNSNLAGVVVTAKRHPYMSVNSNLAEVVVTAKRPVMIQTAGILNFSTESYINSALLNVNELMKELPVISIVSTGNFFVTAIPAVITLLK